MKLLLTIAATMLSASLLTTANAGEFRIGANAGYAYADSHQLDQDLGNAQAYAQYRFDGGFGIEGGYNYLNGEADGDNAVIHGPYLAASINSDVGDVLELYARAGAMYATTDGDIPTDHSFAKFAGVGAQINFADHFYGRAGYDHYFDAADDDIKTDLDVVYAGVGVNF